jgi:hypothetical protein
LVVVTAPAAGVLDGIVGDGANFARSVCRTDTSRDAVKNRR